MHLQAEQKQSWISLQPIDPKVTLLSKDHMAVLLTHNTVSDHPTKFSGHVKQLKILFLD